MAKPKPRNGKEGTLIDAKQQALLAEQEALDAEMQRLQSLIEKAPARKKEQQERRREELIKRASAGSRHIDAPVLQDKRFDVSLAPSMSSGRRKPLKIEQRQARLTFFGLLIALMLLSLWVWSIWQ